MSPPDFDVEVITLLRERDARQPVPRVGDDNPAALALYRPDLASHRSAVARGYYARVGRPAVDAIVMRLVLK